MFDAETTAAVVGQLAGPFYGVAGIRAAWLARIHRGDEIAALAEGLLQRNLAEAKTGPLSWYAGGTSCRERQKKIVHASRFAGAFDNPRTESASAR